MAKGSGMGQRSSLRPLSSSDLLSHEKTSATSDKTDDLPASSAHCNMSGRTGRSEFSGRTGRSDFSNPEFGSKDSAIELLPPLYVEGEKEKEELNQHAEAAPLIHLITTYLGYLILIVTGHVRDFFLYRLQPHKFRHLKVQNGLAPINSGFDTFYHRNLYYRIRDVFNRPITGVPGRTINILERTSKDYNHTFEFSGKTREVLNLSSYNYLGFGENHGPCTDAVEAAIKKHGVSSASSRLETGSLDIHTEAEQLVARFMGQEAAIICSMGFATNSTMLPALIGKGGLIISDELNHSSLVFGARLTGASIKVFKHNDPADLEAVLRDAISQGQPRTHRPWKKILLVVEGLYSMEGNICKLPEFVALKKKYKIYMYLDEAHSVGAMGPNGRGICDYYGIDPSDIDVLMGTFTKSFGAAGGYIAGSKTLIDTLRLYSHSAVYAESISVPVVKQIYSSMRMIMGEDFGADGRHRIQTLARNSRYFAAKLREMGFIVYGHDSPVIPLLLMNPAKIPAFSREMLDRGIAVVVVGYPATPIITSRVRFCISAAHTIEDMDYALEQISIVGDLLLLKMNH